MSEKREPGYYAVKVRGYKHPSIGWFTGADWWLVQADPVPKGRIEWVGPRIFPHRDLVQVRRDELEALRELERVVRNGPYLNTAIMGTLKHLDSLRRREGDNDGS